MKKRNNLFLGFLSIFLMVSLRACSAQKDADLITKETEKLVNLVISVDENSVTEDYLADRYKDLFSTDEAFTAFVKNRQFMISGWLHDQAEIPNLKWNVSEIKKENSGYQCQVTFLENNVEISKVIIKFDKDIKIVGIRKI